MSQAPPRIMIDLTPSFGALYLGAVLSICLLGITTLQTWLYFQRYPQDRKSLKVMVAGVWVLEALHSAFSTHAIYHYLVLNWGNPEALAASLWSLDLTLLITSFIEGVVHLFFARRVYILSGKKLILPIIIIFMAFNNFAFTVTTYGLSIKDHFFANFGHTISVTSTTSLAFAAAADITVAASLWYYLEKSRTGIPKTNMLINKLIFFAINIGILTSVTDIAVLLCSELITGTSLAYLAIYEVVGNFYANSLLATLNARAPQVTSKTDTEFSYPMSSMRIQFQHTDTSTQGNSSRLGTGSRGASDTMAFASSEKEFPRVTVITETTEDDSLAFTEGKKV